MNSMISNLLFFVFGICLSIITFFFFYKRKTLQAKELSAQIKENDRLNAQKLADIRNAHREQIDELKKLAKEREVTLKGQWLDQIVDDCRKAKDTTMLESLLALSNYETKYNVVFKLIELRTELDYDSLLRDFFDNASFALSNELVKNLIGTECPQNILIEHINQLNKKKTTSIKEVDVKITSLEETLANSKFDFVRQRERMKKWRDEGLTPEVNDDFTSYERQWEKEEEYLKELENQNGQVLYDNEYNELNYEIRKLQQIRAELNDQIKAINSWNTLITI